MRCLSVPSRAVTMRTRRCRQSSNCASTALSLLTSRAAAAVGVFTFVCETMSSIDSSLSCPMPVMTGNGKLATFSASARVSNPDMSLVAPPPRIITTQSNRSASAFILFSAAMMLCSTCSPCIVAANSRVSKAYPYSFSASWLQKSPYPAAVWLDITAMRCVNTGSSSSLLRSNTPSSFSRRIISMRLRVMSPKV